MVMGEFRRTHSKVWWFHYPEEDEEDGAHPSPHWGPGLSLSGERRFSSSPSSGSHKSQDSGFSDSESSSPSGSTRSTSGSGIRQAKTPLKEEDDPEVNEVPQESDTTEPEPKFVDPNLLHVSLSRIPRACLSHKSRTDANGSPKIAPNENITLDMNEEESGEATSQDELSRRYTTTTEVREFEPTAGPSYQELHFSSALIQNRRPTLGSHSVSLEIQKSSYQLPAKFNSSECLLNEQNLFSVPKNVSHSCSNLVDKDSDAYRPQTPKPTRISTCFIVEEIPKKSFLQAILNSSDKPQCDQTNSSNISSSAVTLSSDSSSRVSVNQNVQCVEPKELREVTESSVLENIPEESQSSTEVTSTEVKPNETTIRFIGNIDLAKSEDSSLKERNFSTDLTKDKTSKSCNLSWSPITSEAEDSDLSPNKTVVFGCLPTVNELPGAPTHTSTPKGAQNKQQSRKSNRIILGRKGLFQQESQRNWDASVAQWLFELGTMYEAECMTTLQHKCLTSNTGQQVAVMAAASSQFVRDLQQRTKCIANEFSKLYRHVESESKEQLGPLVQSLVGHLTEFMLYIRKTLTKSVFGFSTREASDLSKISKACNRLKTTTAEIPLNFSSFSTDLSYIGKLFSQFVDHLLKCQIKSLIQILEEPESDVTLLSALSGLTGMGLEATHLASLVARCNGVRAILAICLDSQWTTVRVAALRTLATVCCSAQSIRQLEKARGVEVLADILSDEKKSEAELSEAASVLAQITAPWIEDNHKVEGLQDFINIFVTSLTRLVQKTKSSETLLLSSAALANLSFMEPKAVYALLEMGSAGYLLAAVRKLGARASVFLQEQAATMVANMAAVPETRQHLAKHRAVVALLCFLQVRHSPLQRSSEIAAAERLQHKSAIALSRLCSDKEVSQQVVELHGVGRLVRLCKEKRERNHSDAVLVACLAALRKITKNCGTTIMEEHDVSQLVEPRLLDSFLTYSSKQESYV